MIAYYDDETVEDLRASGLRLLQKKDGFRFGEDSVFLAAFAASLYPRSSLRPLRAVDLGCGCGVVSVLLSRRLPAADLTGIEIVPRIAATAARNAALNGLPDRLRFVRADLRDLPDLLDPSGGFLPRHHFDLVVSNPPYRLPTTPVGPDATGFSELVLAREEVACSLDDVVRAAAFLLRSRGRLALVYGPERLPDLMEALRRHGLEPDALRLVQPSADRPPSCLLVSAVAGGRRGGFRVLAPLVVRDAQGRYTDETAALYGHEPPLSSEALLSALVPSGADPAARPASKGG